jgi:hypothetical protein
MKLQDYRDQKEKRRRNQSPKKKKSKSPDSNMLVQDQLGI